MRDHTNKQVVTIQLAANHGLKWSSYLLSPYQVWVKGHVFKGHELFSGARLAQLFVDSITTEDSMPYGNSLQAVLRELNGFFAVVIRDGGRLFVSVDRVRSIPLFYSVEPRRFILSDEAEWVRKEVGDQELDPIAREEFQLTGYVTGNDTLYPYVKQLQAGELLAVQSMPEGYISLQQYRYYRFQHVEPEQYDENQLRSELNTAAVGAIQRLIDYAKGRQIVIPLSGGYDSRLIATLLCHLNYENILAFSYGKPGNKESTYSKRVADSLGIPWLFIEYNPQKWRKAWTGDERRTYQQWASGWSSLPHVQDWLAVREIKRQQLVNEDCVFVPGHTGDFISGGHIPADAIPGQKGSRSMLSSAVLTKHYSSIPMDAVSYSGDFWAARIWDRICRPPISTAEQYSTAFEEWEWQERQSKYIVNSIRVYEFLGYEWWLPLWDAGFMQFWQHVPLTLRHGRKFYIRYVQNIYNTVTENADEVIASLNAETPSPLTRNFEALIRRLLPWQATKTLRSVKLMLTLRNHATFSRFNQHQIEELARKGYSHMGIAASIFLDEL